MEDRPTPLHGVRVVDMCDGAGELCGRVLADLGAEVILVEPPEGASGRRAAPLHEGVSLSFTVHAAGKRSVVIDQAAAAGREQLLALLGGADIWIESHAPGVLTARGLAPELVRERHPELVIVSISAFGQTGPYRDWRADEAVLLAMGGVLSRSGLPAREPLLPPGGIALQVTAMQAAWAALVAYWHRLETGLGDHIDFSLYEATAQALEPAMGTVGTAQAAGYAPTRGRPEPGPYPIVRCADGYVRVALLAPRQWQAMRAWLGEPDDLQDPALESIRGRALAAERLRAAFSQHFASRGKHEAALEGQARGVPVAPVLSLGEVLAAEHFRARGAVERAEIAPRVTADVPVGFTEIDGCRTRPAGPAPRLGEYAPAGLKGRSGRPRADLRDPGGTRRPLEGLRVLDFGVIVYGADCARLFCELGADVIKVESRAFPDGARVSPIHFAIGHRGSRSLGVNLRSPEGIEVIRRLLPRCDLLLTNFKPGTLERLGLGPEVLADINPALVTVRASALGTSGRWSGWMGYGPLVRCVSGLTSLWRYADDEASFSDSTVIHPDHFAARVAALTALAALIATRESGAGADIALSQAEAILMQLGPLLAAESLRSGAAPATGNRREDAVPWGVFPCAGEDEWCVIAVESDAQWAALRAALGEPGWAARHELDTLAGRRAARSVIDAEIGAWTRARAAREVAAVLQRAGVPAGFMQRPEEYRDDPHLRARDFLRTFEQPGLAPLSIENAPFRARRIAPPPSEPAPEPGEHTREICAELLGMDQEEIDALLSAGALEACEPSSRTSVLPMVSPARRRASASGACSRPSTIDSR